MERCYASERTEATLIRGVGNFTEEANATGWYTATCFDANGQVKWEEKFQNIVTTQGKNYLLDQGFAASSTNVLRMGLKLVGTAVLADTYASHASWAESTVYSGSRATPSFSAAASGSKTTASVAVFNITGTATITGCFLAMAPTATTLGTIGDTSATGAVLYSAGDFAASKSVTSGDILNVTYTASL